MCTAFKYKTYMGRNFDYEISLGEQIITIPANEYDNKYAIIGICTGIVDDYPLLYDGMNENGLCMAGLAFEGNAGYSENGIPAYDFILRILGKYESVTEFIADKPTVSNEQYKDIPNSDLHWFLCDSERAVIVESIDGEMRIHNALTEVLTNNPPLWGKQLRQNKVALSPRNIQRWLHGVSPGDREKLAHELQEMRGFCGSIKGASG